MDKHRAYNRDLERFFDRIMEQTTQALEDDVGTGDVTTHAVVREVVKSEEAVIYTKSAGILCGLHEAQVIFEAGGLCFHRCKTEGASIQPGEIVAKVYGPIGELLKRERTAINYLQVLSGIATATSQLVGKHPKKVASLRKTHPGLCFSEKRAVKAGGGFTHRLGLFDGLLIKDNHLACIVRELYGSVPITEQMKIEAIKTALKRAKQYREEHELTSLFIEIEVESLEQMFAALECYRAEGVPDMILLDNMQPDTVTKCVTALRAETNNDILLEASGGITPENIHAYIEAGVDVVSTSKITFAAKPLDIAMKILGYK
ncbi:MAG: carboxylating nicotinate-nucleotide diphosphorylase [Candidatus Bathyarchaeota archaeon]|nr:MAG: carboxylating nicotinate-nucleotide diphosphorylase [Candidatus Bathyarchaeota archaeon]